MNQISIVIAEPLTEGVWAPLVNFPDNFKSENLNNQVSNSTIEKKNSQMNEQNKLQTFLNQFKIGKGLEYTHTSIGNPISYYSIPREHKVKLIDLLYESIFIDLIPVHLTEKTPQLGGIPPMAPLFLQYFFLKSIL